MRFEELSMTNGNLGRRGAGAGGGFLRSKDVASSGRAAGLVVVLLAGVCGIY
jgi:hypothetical protein